MYIRRQRAPLFAATLAGCMLAAGARAQDAFTPGYHGFLESGGAFTQIDAPGGQGTAARGINDAGQIVGVFSNGTGATVSSTAAGPSPKLMFPALTLHHALGINDAGQIVGYFGNSTGAHGFLDTGGTFTQIDFPGASGTYALRHQRRGADRREF